MPKFNMRWNVQHEHLDKITALGLATGLSKSAIISNALASAIADPKGMFNALLDTPIDTPATVDTGHKPASYMVDMDIRVNSDKLAEQLHFSRDLMLRLALDYYLYRAIHQENHNVV